MSEITDRYVAAPVDARFHGTPGGYTNHKCRCAPCTGAHAAAMQRRKMERAAFPASQVPHGVNGYSNYCCRCLVCRTAWAALSQAAQLRNQARPTPERVHGSNNGYINYKCRCVRCRAAHAKYHQKDECVDDIWC